MTATSIIFRIVIASFAFSAANQADRPVARAVGLALLIGSGVLLLVGALSVGSFLAGILGVGSLLAAGYAYWTNR